MQIGGYITDLLGLFDKRLGPIIRVVLEVPGIADKIKAGKSIRKAFFRCWI